MEENYPNSTNLLMGGSIETPFDNPGNIPLGHDEKWRNAVKNATPPGKFQKTAAASLPINHGKKRSPDKRQTGQKAENRIGYLS